MRVPAAVGLVVVLLVVAACTPIADRLVGGVAYAQSMEPTVTTPTTNDEVTMLRAQLEEMRRSTDQMITLIQWGLGIPLTIAVLLVAYNVYQGRWAERENRRTAIEDIGREVRAENAGEFAAFRTLLREEVDAFREQIERRLADSESENRAFRDAQEFEQTRTADLLQKFMAEHVRINRAEMRADFVTLERSFNEMRYQIVDETVRRSFATPLGPNIYVVLELLDAALSLGGTDNRFSGFRVVHALVTLRKALLEAKMLSEEDIGNAAEALKKVPDSLAAYRDRVQEVIRTLEPTI